jgi:hypothetical protein
MAMGNTPTSVTLEEADVLESSDRRYAGNEHTLEYRDMLNGMDEKSLAMLGMHVVTRRTLQLGLA